MRFISKYGLFGVQIRAMVEEAFASGGSRIIQPPVYAMFKPGKLLPNEYEFALANWSSWNGSYQMSDEVTTVPPDYRIGAFDSVEAQRDQNWTDELRVEVEQALIKNAEHTDNILVVPSSLIPPPWPRYDEYLGDVDQLIQVLVEQGHSLSETLAYERANQDRPEIVDALESLLDDPEALVEYQHEEVLG